MVSIIVPVYNGEKTIERCVKAISQQTYEDIEIIVVNDGSKDNTSGVCDLLKENDSRVKIINKDNEGAMLARLTGLKYAKGQYIVFSDADDWMERDMIGSLMEAAKKADADIVNCRYTKDYSSGKKTISSSVNEVLLYSPEEALLELNLDRSIESSICNKLIKRAIFEKAVFEKTVNIGEDYSMVWYAICHSKRIVCIPNILYHYVQNSNSRVHQGYIGGGVDIIENYSRIKDETILFYPNLRQAAIAFCLLQEMAIIISMTRNNNYDNEVIQRVRKDVKMNFDEYIGNKTVPFHLKVCAFLLTINSKILIILYKLFFKWRDKI